MEGQEFTIITPNGKKVLTGKNFEKLAFHTIDLTKSYLSPESIVSYGVGTGVAFLTGGNITAGAVTKSIVKDVVSGYRYDRSLEDTLETLHIKLFPS